ncbi:phospholipase [Erysipelothrix sp. HDW6C]|nr:phospholipase [Erysipelothrix sp. HDW6C]
MEHVFFDNGSDKTLVLFHGTGGDETVLLPVARMVAPTMNHLSLRGDVVVNGMRRFCKVSNETQLMDEQDMLDRVPNLLDVVNTLKKQYNLGEMWALGFSNGANTIEAMLLEVETPFEKAILLRPMNMEIATRELPLKDMTILIHSGRFDDIIPFEGALALEQRLQANGADVTHKIYDLDHRMRQFELDDIKQWFEKELENE